jgi:RHS repeat-associated protein
MIAAGCCPANPLSPPPVSDAQCPTCDLDISNFTASPSTIDGNSGGTVKFSIGITSSRPYTWTATIKRKDDPNSPDILIAGGSAVGSTSLDVEWTVKDLLDKLIEPGTYTATLTATTADGYCTKSADTEIIIKGNPKTCPLKHPVGSSLELASGNLNHSQTLFSLPKSPLMSGFTLTYNSRDGYNEALGTGWSHNYNLILKYISTRNIYVLMDSSGEKIALYNNGSFYTPDISTYPILVKNSDNTLTLTYKDRSVYNFNAQGKITTIADKNSNAVNFTYNSGSNLISIADQTGKTITLGYDTSNRISSMADPNNNSYAFTYTGNTLTAVSSTNSLGTQTWQYTYDDKGFMLTKTDPQGNLFQYSYDANHNLNQTIDPQGRTINVQYNPGNKTTTVTEKDGGIWVYKYDPVLGTLTSKTDPVSGLASNVYDANRNLISRTEADSGTTTYTYDANGNQTSVTDPLGKTTTYTYNSLNLVASVTDPKGHVTQYGYDTSGNLTSVTDATNAVTRYQYDAKGNIIAITNPLGKTTSMIYDQNNNLLTVTDPKGGTVRMTYDNIGNMIRQTDALGNVTTFQYNSLNQMTQITEPLGKVTRYTYDYKGNRLSATDPNGNISQYVYDYNGQITRITDALNNITNMAYGQTGCSSCGSGVDKLTSLTDAKNQNTSYVYDEAGRLTREADPLGKVTTYIYDSKGNLISRTNPDNKTTTFTYDLNNRLKQKTYSDGSITTFQYDTAGNMTYAGNANIAYNFTYDAGNRNTQITDSNGRTISYQYDDAGNRTAMITPDGKTIAYTYDFNNLPARITTDLGAFTFSYDANNRRTTRTLPNGTTSTYSYDQASRLTSIQTTKNSTTIDYTSYTLDNIGNRLTKNQNSVNYNYTYDSIYRLTQATPSSGSQESYSYDSVGNRLTKVPDTAPSVNETTQYSYDDENHLTGVTITQGSLVKQLTFAYDPFGRRIRKTVSPSGGGSGEETTNYVYDGQNIIMEYGQSGNITASYTHGPGTDEPLTIQKNSQTYYYHNDGLGSITALTNANGTVVQTYSYDSFGNVTSTGSVSQPLTYTGREYDSETGMYFYRARYYDPKVGRFVTKDPIGFGGGDYNIYAYVNNSPINRGDPMGLGWLDSWPWNGNLWPGFSPQTEGCDKPAPQSLNKNKCMKKCCDQHDACYATFNCNWSSWLPNFFPGPCKICNIIVTSCIAAVKIGGCPDDKCK